MSYYVLPKMNHKILFDIQFANDTEAIVSNSIIDYYNDMTDELKKISVYESEYNDILKMYNPSEYIFTNVHGSFQTVSKLTTKSNMFYDLYELMKTINILENYQFDAIYGLVIGKHYYDMLEVLEMLREKNSYDNFFCFEYLNNNYYDVITNNKFNLVMYEFEYDIINIDVYAMKWLEVLHIILNSVSYRGCAIIKFHTLFHKPIIDALFVMSNNFEKVYIIKPTTSDVFSFEKYIVLKNLNNKQNMEINLLDVQKNYLFKSSQFISNIIKNDIPYFFMTKINDLNVMLGKQQLEAFGELLAIVKHKNKEEKLELLKKINIQKCVNWCEKYNIPCNKFSLKVNVFLPMHN